MTIIDQIVQWLAPWQSLYADSTVISSGVKATHVLAMLYGGGLAIGADRSTLRILRRGSAERDGYLAELSAIHRPVLGAMAVLFLSGLLLAAADFEVFIASPVFWTKLGLVALLVVNGAVLVRTETRLRSTISIGEPAPVPVWSRLRWNARASVVLWSLTLIVGVVLVEAA